MMKWTSIARTSTIEVRSLRGAKTAKQLSAIKL